MGKRTAKAPAVVGLRPNKEPGAVGSPQGARGVVKIGATGTPRKPASPGSAVEPKERSEP